MQINMFWFLSSLSTTQSRFPIMTSSIQRMARVQQAEQYFNRTLFWAILWAEADREERVSTSRLFIQPIVHRNYFSVFLHYYWLRKSDSVTQ